MDKAQLLDDYLRSSGKAKTYLAKVLGVSRTTLYHLLKNPPNCTFGQADILSKELNINKMADKKFIFLP